MSWTNIDDRILSHPKMKRAVKIKGDAAWTMWSRGLVYTNAYDLDGRIPKDVVDELTMDRKPFEVAAVLVEVGLWETREDGDYQVHDYKHYNDSREERDARRAAGRERLKKHRDRKAGLGTETSEKQPQEASQSPSETRFTPVADTEQKRVPKSVIPSQANPSQSKPSQAVGPAAAPAGLGRSEQAVLDALATWPALEPLATPDMVRQIQATAAPAGWSPADILAGIAELGAKHGMATAAVGALDPGKLATKLAGFIKSAHLLRRSGGKEAPAAHGGYPGRPPTVEAPSLASQMPFTRAPREAS